MAAAAAASEPHAGPATGIIAKGEIPDREDVEVNDAEAAAWYAAAAAGGDDEEDEEEEDEEEEGSAGGVQVKEALAEDPYQAESDPYAASDPYVLADPYLEASAGAADAAMSDTAQASAVPMGSVAPAIVPMEGSETGTEAASALRRPPAEEQPPQKAPRTQESAQPLSSLQQAPATSSSASTAPAPPPLAPIAPAPTTSAAPSASEAKATPVDGTRPADPAAGVSPTTRQATTAAAAAQPPPAPPMPAIGLAGPLHAQAQAQPAQAHSVPSPDQAQAPPRPAKPSEDGQQAGVPDSSVAEVDWGPAEDDVPEPPVPVEGDDGRTALPSDANFEDVSWDEKVIVVRQAQIHIELQHREPPMEDATLLQFCDWLDEQLPLVVANFPYIRKSGAYVDLSDNVIGPEGLDKLFRVLRDHRVPCVVMKAYRNVLDDSIVDTLIEYLYTQPEAFPMHGIHISHNNVTDKGAMRLIRAAAQCGHYPRLTSRLPLWLRLEANNIANPNKVVADCLEEKVNVCMMGDGLCSRPDCNHYSGVHVQLPYFFSQGRKGPGQHNSSAIAHSAREALSPPPPPPMQEPPSQAMDAEMDESEVPDWMRRGAGTSQTGMVPAPKKQGAFRGATPSQAFKLMGMSRLVRPSMAPQQPPLPPPPSRPSSWGGGDAAAGLSSLGSSAKSAAAPPPRPNWGWSGGDGDAGGGCAGDSSGGWGKGWGKEAGVGNFGGGGKGCGKWGGGKGKGWGRRQMWQGPALDTKVKRDVKLGEGEASLGFEWVFVGGGKPPRVISVEIHSKVSEATQVGESMLRINGLDAAMFTQKQIHDMLKQRPVALRFGDA